LVAESVSLVENLSGPMQVPLSSGSVSALSLTSSYGTITYNLTVISSHTSGTPGTSGVDIGGKSSYVTLGEDGSFSLGLDQPLPSCPFPLFRAPRSQPPPGTTCRAPYLDTMTTDSQPDSTRRTGGAPRTEGRSARRIFRVHKER
jgi:hypothetical protein